VIGTIALADLRVRLLDRLHSDAPPLAIALSDPPAEEIDIDVVF
jgi:hypothetical protein